MDRAIFIDGVLGRETATVREIIDIVRASYCGRSASSSCTSRIRGRRPGSSGGSRARPWTTGPSTADGATKRAILQQLTEAEGFEAFCQKRYVGTKRFGLEGGEVTIPALHAIIETAAAAGAVEVAIGMPHRGRLNTLVNIVRKPFTAVFSEFGGEQLQAGRRAGLGRREVSPRARARTSRSPGGNGAHQLAAEPEPPGGGGPGRGRQGAGAAGRGRATRRAGTA